MIPEAFFVGGKYMQTDDGQRMYGQAYVQRRAAETTHPYPMVLIHGGHQTSVNFETTPDGRPGWSDFFVAAGYDTYLLDQPGRGRSAYIDQAYGKISLPYPTKRVEDRFTAGREKDLWPRARLHSQWPGSGTVGDPVFDQFYASQAPSITDASVREDLMRQAGAALLDRIGPAVLLTHSQSAHFGWHIADARPELVKAIVAVEPGGPPFVGFETVGAPGYYRDGPPIRPYGLTVNALTFDPPVIDPETDLVFRRQAAPDADGFAPCHLLQEPRRLVNLAKVPVAVITGEASYHAGLNHCAVAFLRQCGVSAEHIRLEDRGLHGNGHMMMLEKNSDDVAALIEEWLRGHELAG